MELRSAEDKVRELYQLYERTRWAASANPSLHLTTTTTTMEALLPSLVLVGDVPPSSLAPVSTAEEEGTIHETDRTTGNHNDNDDHDVMVGLDAAAILHNLEAIHVDIQRWEARMDRFQTRLKERDPVTDKPRYGPQTMVRVERVLSSFRQLQSIIGIMFPPAEHRDQDGEILVQEIRKAVEREAAEQRQRELLEQEREQRQQEEIRLKQQQEYEEQHRKEEEARQEELHRRNELARQAEQIRMEQIRAQDEADRADREWVAGITKGPEGVKDQLGTLLKATENDLMSRKTAITALHTLFSQIVARPEEPSFRRIRRDHPRFNAEIGRLPGGREVLIAAGFRLGKIDEIPSFISTEPDIETDMDSWSAWFDLLKAALGIIEETLILI